MSDKHTFQVEQIFNMASLLQASTRCPYATADPVAIPATVYLHASLDDLVNVINVPIAC